MDLYLDIINFELVKKYQGKQHPYIRDAYIFNKEITVDEYITYNDCTFDDCSFIGEEYMTLFQRCRFVNCRYDKKLINNFLQCIDLGIFNIDEYMKSRGCISDKRNFEVKETNA